MKTRFFTIVCSVLFFASCDKDPIVPTKVTETVTQGTWRVSYYSKNGNGSELFDGYVFTFSADGSLSAKKGSNHVNGTWSTSIFDNDTKLDMDLGHISPFDEISDDWNVTGLKPSRVETESPSAAGGPYYYLTFEQY